ncbi:MAG: DUF4280 domain-containing protein [Acidimicrobiales bacterium]
MPQQVVNTAVTQCSFGETPGTLIVLPINRVLAGEQPAATIMDHIPIVNIEPFGMCNSISNPVVAAATAAKLGVFTPMPCVPVVPAPWVPGADTVLIGSMPALDNMSKCMCTWGGVIEVVMPGQLTVEVP